MQSPPEGLPEEGRYFPATHGTQSAEALLPVASLYVPAGQSMQLVLFEEPLYLPGTHSRQLGVSQPAGQSADPSVATSRSQTGTTAGTELHPLGQFSPSSGFVAESRSHCGGSDALV